MHVTRAWIACLLPLLLSGCAIGYGMQAARGQWAVMRAAKPIDEVLTAPSTSERLRGQLREVREVRSFAARELGLPDNASYTRYAALGRPYVVWNVVAAGEFSLAPRRWCFPVAGCVNYRGYFSELSAERFAARLRRAGFDVAIGGVPAYSTLGYFADPVPDSLLRYGDLAVAETIIHELAHQRVYLAGDSDINEAFATVVAEEGLRRWLHAANRTADLARLEAQSLASGEAARLLAEARRSLQALYESPLPADQKRADKRQRLAQLGAELVALEARHGVRFVYSEWVRAGLGNAHLVADATYSRCVPGLRRLLAAVGMDLAVFYSRVEALAREPRQARQRALCA